MNRLGEYLGLFNRPKQEPVIVALLALVSDSAVYLVGGLLVGLGNIFLIPLYTRLLTPRQFGLFALIDIGILMAVTLSLLKMDVSYLKWFADLDLKGKKQLLGATVLAGLTASCIAGAILSFVSGSRLWEYWAHDRVGNYAWLFLPIVVLENIMALLLTDLRARRKAVLYSMAALCKIIGIFVASYYTMSMRHMGLPGLFLGRLAGDAAGVIFLALFCLRSVVWKFSYLLFGPMLRFGLPLIWAVLAVMVQDAAGRYFLVHYGTLEQVGLLGAAIKVSGVFQMLVSTPFGVAWGGILFQIVKQSDAQLIYSKILEYVYVLALSVALVLTIFGPTLFRIFTAPAYYSAVVILPLVLLVRVMNVVEQPAATGIYLSSKTGIFAVIYTVALATNIALLYLLVPRYGTLGVGWAWFLGSAIVPFLDLLFGRRLYRLRFSPKLALLPLLPWIFPFIRVANNAAGTVRDSFSIECGCCALLLVFISTLLLHDVRDLRQRLSTRDRSADWECATQ